MVKFSWLLQYKIFYPLKINHTYFISLEFSVAICLHFILLANCFVNVIIVSIAAIAQYNVYNGSIASYYNK